MPFAPRLSLKYVYPTHATHTCMQVFAGAQAACQPPSCDLKLIKVRQTITILGGEFMGCRRVLVAGQAAEENADAALFLASKIQNTTWMILDNPFTEARVRNVQVYNNVQYWRFRRDHQGYLLGALAAKLSIPRNRHVGAITGNSYPGLLSQERSLLNGFLFGARRECNYCKVLTTALDYENSNKTEAVLQALVDLEGDGGGTPDFVLVTGIGVGNLMAEIGAP